jgi:hypothetical protein
MTYEINSHTQFLRSQQVLVIQNTNNIELRHTVFQTSCHINQVGYSIWQLLEQPQTLEMLGSQLVRQYDVSPEIASRTLENLLEQLHGLGFIGVQYANLPQDPMRQWYLELLQKALMNLLYPEHELRIRHLLITEKPTSSLETDRLLRDIRSTQPEQYAEIMASKQVGGVLYNEVTRYSHTAIGIRRLENLQACAEAVFAGGIAGDFLEAGVCQGGASIFMRALQVAYGQAERLMWVADSFAGLPVPTADLDVQSQLDWSEPRQPWLAMSLETVQEHFRRYDMLSSSVHFLQGWFADTLPTAPIQKLAILRLDADLYSSTTDILEALYKRVSVGGFIIVDDYAGIKACREAVDEFRTKNSILEPIRRVDWSCVYWRKA